ncbi:hypothetical protein WH47_10253 [Habropoda laboriosa]|uniref:Uncharacterized protein n=1 Tax=Habropoda laboriosa TaxID=597456 RepID=A0A0L7R4U0_9HYME|nr:hypothetical protein WH47_10253 [Habropoda laboriosa]
MYENQHAVNQSRYQYQFSRNVWAGIIGDMLIGSAFFLHGGEYTEFAETELSTLGKCAIRDTRSIVRNRSSFFFKRIARRYLHKNWDQLNSIRATISMKINFKQISSWIKSNSLSQKLQIYSFHYFRRCLTRKFVILPLFVR